MCLHARRIQETGNEIQFELSFAGAGKATSASLGFESEQRSDVIEGQPECDMMGTVPPRTA